MRLAALIPVSALTITLLPACAPVRTGPRYQADIAVFARPGQGARMCAEGVDGYMPGCPSVPLVGWHWSAVRDSWVDGRVRESRAHVIGRWDGHRFHVERAADYVRPPVLLQVQGAPACRPPQGDPKAPPPTADPAAFGPGLVDVWVTDGSRGWNGPAILSVVVRPGGAEAAERAARRTYAGPLCVTEKDKPTLAEQLSAQRTLQAEAKRWHLVRAVLVPWQAKVVATVLVVTDGQQAEARRRWGDAVSLDPTLRPVVRGG